MVLDYNPLRSLIGRRVVWLGHHCEIVEVLEDGPMLVLRSDEPARPIHGNRHGDAGRRAPDTFEVPVVDAQGRVHPEFLALIEP